jgi:hypothetical protein
MPLLVVFAQHMAMEPGLLLKHKRDEPFRAPHIFPIALAQMLLEDMLFHPDTITETDKRACRTRWRSRANSALPNIDQHQETGLEAERNRVSWRVSGGSW